MSSRPAYIMLVGGPSNRLPALSPMMKEGEVEEVRLGAWLGEGGGACSARARIFAGQLLGLAGAALWSLLRVLCDHYWKCSQDLPSGEVSFEATIMNFVSMIFLFFRPSLSLVLMRVSPLTGEDRKLSLHFVRRKADDSSKKGKRLRLDVEWTTGPLPARPPPGMKVKMTPRKVDNVFFKGTTGGNADLAKARGGGH